MKTELDARGLACPKPVIEAKKALEGLEQGTLIILVDNEVARDNVMRFAKNGGHHVEVLPQGTDWEIKLIKKAQKADLGSDQLRNDEFAVLVTTPLLGQGDPELGRVLMKSYFFALVETTPLPKAVLFLNSGVNLACEGSPVLNEVEILEAKGVEVCICGTCLDFYQLKQNLRVGRVSNMYDFVETMAKMRVISL